MKKFLTIILVVVSVQLFAQTNPITAISITLPANPDANTDNWGTGTSLFMISATTQTANGQVYPTVEESKLLVIIKQGGNKVCGAYTSNTAPQSDFNTIVKVWSGANAASFLGKGCILPPGDYEVSVQFFGNAPLGGPVGIIPLSAEQTKPFTIKGNDQQAYQPPQAIAPADGTVLNQEDIKKPITFRWTPVVPKPQDPVTYHLSVWQLMVGQTGTQAMKANTPIITKDVDNITQAVITNLVTGPCLPPYLCDFVWNVQALNREGKPIGGNNGTSGTNSFSVSSASCGTVTADSIVKCNGYNSQGLPVYTITINLKNNPTSGTAGCNAKYTGVSIYSGGGFITSPVGLPATITPTNTATISFNYSPGNSGAPSASFKLTGTWSDQLQNTVNLIDSVRLPSCICKDCDSSSMSFKPTGITPVTNSNNQVQVSITGNINVSGLPAVYGIEMQVQSYNYSANPAACSNGVTSAAQSGMFLPPNTSINGTTAIQMFNDTGSGGAGTANNVSKIIKLVSTTPLPNSIPVNLVMGLPGPLAGLNKECCKINYNLCLKIIVFYDKAACKSCVFTYCFPPFSN